MKVYHRMNLVWGVTPILANNDPDSFDGLVQQVEDILLQRGIVVPGDQVLMMGGIPARTPQGTNFLKLHRIPEKG